MRLWERDKTASLFLSQDISYYKKKTVKNSSYFTIPPLVYNAVKTVKVCPFYDWYNYKDHAIHLVRYSSPLFGRLLIFFLCAPPQLHQLERKHKVNAILMMLQLNRAGFYGPRMAS